MPWSLVFLNPAEGNSSKSESKELLLPDAVQAWGQEDPKFKSSQQYKIRRGREGARGRERNIQERLRGRKQGMRVRVS